MLLLPKGKGGKKMKQRISSLCLAFVMVATSVLGISPQQEVKAADAQPYTFEVEAELGAEGSGQFNTSVGTEKDSEGNDVTYASFPAQWNNGRYIVNFPYAGTYKMQLRIAVPGSADQVYLEVSPAGADSFTSQGNKKYTASATANTYTVEDYKTITIEEPGDYDLKFGNWASSSDFKVDKFIFTCDNPQIPDPDAKLTVKKGEVLTLKEANAANKNGSLKNAVASGNYVDYNITVEESGDYTLVYNIAANSAAVQDAFQILAGAQKEDIKEADFTQKLAPVQLTHYYSAIQMKQSIHLEAGDHTLRTKALADGGFSLTRFTIEDQKVHALSADSENGVTIGAADCVDGTDYYAIENNGGNIGYAASGLALSYVFDVPAGGIYHLSYNYGSNGVHTLTAQRMIGDVAADLEISTLATTAGSGNWYDAKNYKDSEAVDILLPAGKQTFRILWGSDDTNLKAMTLTYAGSAVDYVKGLITDLPAKEELTLEEKAAVVKARNSYDALTTQEKGQIEAALVTKLTDCEAQIAALELAKAKEDNRKDLNRTFETYQESEYRADKWAQVTAAKAAGLAAIENAKTIAEAEETCKTAKEAMAAVAKKLKSIVLNNNNTITLAQSKAYRKNGFLNSNVKKGNYLDYYVDVKEAGDYSFTYALYSDEVVNDAFVIKYDNSENSEYPETLTNEYGTISTPVIRIEGNLVKEIRRTVSLKAGEQTIRFEAKSDKAKLNRITIKKINATEIPVLDPGITKNIKAADFTEAKKSYVLASGIVTGTEDGTTLDYPVSVTDEMHGDIYFETSYKGTKKPELEVSKVEADGKETKLGSVVVTEDHETTEGIKVILPKGTYTLRITVKNDSVDLKNMILCGTVKPVAADSIALEAYELVMDQGEVFYLGATLVPAEATSEIKWSSSDERVAIVENGQIKAVKKGTAVITAEADGKKAECKVIVGEREAQTEAPDTSNQPTTVPAFIKKVSAEPQSTTLYAGGNENSTAIHLVIPTGAKLAKAEYSSDNTAVAEISAAGMIQAKKAGKAVITVKVTLTNGESTSLKTSVTVKKAYIKLKKANYSVKKGKTVALKADVYGSTKKVNFKIANKAGKKIAKVTKSGKLTGKKKGSVKVTAYAGKVKKTFKVKVK